MGHKPPPPETPEAQVFLEEVPEKILIKGKDYSLAVKILNITDMTIDCYLRYRINGFKILSVSDPTGSGEKFSMDPLKSVSYEIFFTPEIEGPLQLEIELRGWKKNHVPVEKEYDVQSEQGVRKEKRLEYDVQFEEIALHQTSGYMEAVISGIEELDTFITQGDVSTEIVTDVGAISNSIIFYFPSKQLNPNLSLLRKINKQMFKKSGKNFLFLNYAISPEFPEQEQRILKQGIDKFLPKLDRSKRLLIFNLDFLPKMMVPTIVLGASPRSVAVQEKLASVLGSQVAILVDTDVFVGGNLFEALQYYTQDYDADIVNIALSAEFQDNKDLFINFINQFVE